MEIFMEVFSGIVMSIQCIVFLMLCIGLITLIGFLWFLFMFKIYRVVCRRDFQRWLNFDEDE